MAISQTVLKEIEWIPYYRWNSKLPVLARQYQQNQPFPHIHLPNFLDFEIAQAMADEFPIAGTDAWTHYKHQNEDKLGMAKRGLFPFYLGEVTDELNSPRFLAWLSTLTGIPNLMADPSLEGGGLHQSTAGGFLNVHSDFTTHHYQKNWRRRVNLILYLNPDWDETWGGDLEFWDISMQHCVAKYPPLLNHAVIFTTDERSFHGFPEPLRCPPEISRKSLALYFYTVDHEIKSGAHSTNYRARPGDGLRKSLLIWLDKQAVDLYSRAKARFGFSDEFASKVLKYLSRRK